MLTTTAFEVHAIPADVTAALRSRDDAGRASRVVVDGDGGSPLRCCLRSSRPGERILLVSYAPLRRWAASNGVDPGPYDETGPVFLHADECAGPAHSGYPEDFRGSRRMLRAYTDDCRILAGRCVEPGDAPEPVIAELFADGRVAVIHARAVEFGCFTFEIRRRSPLA
ncbi:MAG: hypothetical protein QOJ03_3234 [Frankiaceae bacterium]|nr:hypothetical protein [Frankiaceae bacterium]